MEKQMKDFVLRAEKSIKIRLPSFGLLEKRFWKIEEMELQTFQ